MNDSDHLLSLRDAIHNSLDDYGTQLLKQPHRLVSYVLDLTREDDRDAKIIIQQLNDELLEPVQRVVFGNDSRSMEDLRAVVSHTLTDMRSIESTAASHAADALVGGVADHLGKPLEPLPPDEKSSAGPSVFIPPSTPPSRPSGWGSNSASSRGESFESSRQAPRESSSTSASHSQTSHSQTQARQPAYVPPPVPAAQTKPRTPNWLVGLCVFLLCSVVGVSFVLFSSNSSQTADVTDATNPNEADEVESGQAEDEASEAEEEKPAPVFTTAEANTELEPDNYSASYAAQNVLNDNDQYAWNADYSDGAWIEISADSPQYVSGIRILNGYIKNEDVYAKNCRPRGITIELSDGYSLTAELEDVYRQKQKIEFDKTHETTYIRITVNTWYDGWKYDDCCISRIEAF